MVVKFADTQKEKDQKRIHQSPTASAAANIWGGIPPQYLAVFVRFSIPANFQN